jgi:hypothetical protein
MVVARYPQAQTGLRGEKLSPEGYLTTLTFAGLIIGFAGGALTRLWDASTTDAQGRKVMTASGRLAFAISILGFSCSISSELLKVYIQSEAAKQKLVEQALAQARLNEEADWRRRTTEIETRIANNTDEQLRKSKNDFAKVLEEFGRNQKAIIRTEMSIHDARQRLSTPIGLPAIAFSFLTPCLSGSTSRFCDRGLSSTATSSEKDFLRAKPGADMRLLVCAIKSSAAATNAMSKDVAEGCDLAFELRASAVDQPKSLGYNRRPDNKTVHVGVVIDQQSGHHLELISNDGKVTSMFDLVGSSLLITSHRRSELSELTVESGRITNVTGQQIELNENNCRPSKMKIRIIDYNEYASISYLPSEEAGIVCKIRPQDVH